MQTIRKYLGATILLLAASRLAQAETRTWTDSSGKYRIEAEFVVVQEGKVRLKKPDGQVITVALGSLSQADCDYIDRLASAKAQPAKTQPDGDLVPGSNVALELSGGAKLEGELTARDDASLTVRVRVGGRDFTRKIPLDRVRAITVDGQRRHMGAADDSASAGSPTSVSPAEAGKQRTRADVKALIAELGRTPPDWWDSVPLNYPPSLDLAWPEKPPGKWNASQNVGQYIWDVVNPNPSKWREGIRFVHHLLSLHEQDPEKRARAMRTLGNMYHDLLQDYARAAFWWEKAGLDRGTPLSAGAIELAHCYWRLGNKQMALELLGRAPMYFSSVKLLADMGETKRALQLAESGAGGDFADLAYLYAGDACRVSGQHQLALDYYQRTLKVQGQGKAQKRVERSHQRAQASIDGIRIFDALDLARVPDGTYRGASPGYAGDVGVAVEVRKGRIESVKVVEHKEKQFYGAIAETPAKIIAKQGLKGVDTTSGATMTSEAIVNAAARALSGAAK